MIGLALQLRCPWHYVIYPTHFVCLLHAKHCARSHKHVGLRGMDSGGEEGIMHMTGDHRSQLV